ncbi:MAG TPA: FdhF/YdeP family oxidoreductase [Holophagaceae bacterium]|nr:FdhF/YdeP family oxidoreductase [Holophagaceae bacterium]
MARSRVSAAGGFAALKYVFRKGGQAGFFRLWKRMRSGNACKTCALGMGGARGGMVNEAGHFPEVCKKGIQGMAADLMGAIPEAFFRDTPIARLQWMTPRELEGLGRLAFPLIKEPGDTHLRRCTWDEALARTAEAFRAAKPEEAFVYASGRASNEAAFLLGLVARAYGTSNVHNCSFYCHQASGVALTQIYGSGTSSLVLEDLGKADLAFVIGANPASNHPRLITQLVELRQRGGTVIVVNPLKELGLVRFRVPSLPLSMVFGSKISDLYLQPRIGGDIALLKGLLKGVLERGGLDAAFVDGHTTGFAEVRTDVEGTPWDRLVEESGVPRAQMDATVSALLKAKAGVALWAMGLTHHVHGVDNILALGNVWLSRGWLGREGAGLLPIRGHSNVQGVGSMGIAPTMKEAFAQRLKDLYDLPILPPGQDTMASMRAAAEGRILVSLQLGGNLYGSNPDAPAAAKALQAIPFTAIVSTKLNTTHAHGLGQTCVILPALTRDEEPQTTTQESMFNHVRFSEGGAPSLQGDMRSEVAIFADLAERLLPEGRFDWSRMHNHTALREEIAKAVQGYEPVAAGREFQVPGRTFHTPAFATPDGRAHFAVTPLPRFEADGPLRLMTIRSEGQFNTVVYEDEDLYRGIPRRDAVLVSEADAARLGLKEGDRVKVRSTVGSMAATLFTTDIAEGSCAMYCPEANVLVPSELDPRSKTPAFKHVGVTLERWTS